MGVAEQPAAGESRCFDEAWLLWCVSRDQCGPGLCVAAGEMPPAGVGKGRAAVGELVADMPVMARFGGCGAAAVVADEHQVRWAAQTADGPAENHRARSSFLEYVRVVCVTRSVSVTFRLQNPQRRWPGRTRSGQQPQQPQGAEKVGNGRRFRNTSPRQHMVD